MSPANGAVQTEVNLGPCRCAGSPHAQGDIVWLRPKAGIDMGLAATVALRHSGTRPGDVQAALGMVFLRYGISGWTFTDENHEVVPVTADNIDLWLPWDEGGFEVADRADDLYGATVIAPLVRRSEPSPPPTPGEPSTSATPPSGDQPPTSSAPSSQ